MVSIFGILVVEMGRGVITELALKEEKRIKRIKRRKKEKKKEGKKERRKERKKERKKETFERKKIFRRK